MHFLIAASTIFPATPPYLQKPRDCCLRHVSQPWNCRRGPLLPGLKFIDVSIIWFCSFSEETREQVETANLLQSLV